MTRAGRFGFVIAPGVRRYLGTANVVQAPATLSKQIDSASGAPTEHGSDMIEMFANCRTPHEASRGAARTARAAKASLTPKTPHAGWD